MFLLQTFQTFEYAPIPFQGDCNNRTDCYASTANPQAPLQYLGGGYYLYPTNVYFFKTTLVVSYIWETSIFSFSILS